jgi:hypothetical protein
MPDKKITDLDELTTAVSTDVLAIVDVAANVTKKIQVGNLPGGSGGGVTAVTGTAPITSSGGATPDIGISAATVSAAGSMSAADKAKLDGIAAGAQVGTVTSVATGTGLTGGTITGTGTITLDADLADLNNVAATAPGDGQVLTYDIANGWQPETPSSGGVSSLNALTGALDIQGLGTNTQVIASGNSIQITGNVVGDTTPQLGGNLDVQGFEIDTSVSNGNIKVAANGSGVVEVRGNQTGGNNVGAIKLNCEQNSHGVTIKSPLHSATATYELTLPEADGAQNQPMVTNGSGQLSFSDTIKATLQGSVSGAQINFKAETAAATNAGDAEGTVVYFGTGGTTAGKVYTFNSGAWVAVDASVGGEATTKGLLAMALGTVPATDGMLIQGIGVLDHNPGAAGNILYVTTGTAGELTATQPSTADEYSRVVAHQIGIEGGSRAKVLFTPSQDWIKIA